MKQDRVFATLSLAAKAGKVVSGEYQTEHAVKTETAHLVIVADDASDNTKKMFQNMCEYYHVPFALYGDREQLGHCIGKEFRASVALTDQGIAKLVQKNLIIEN